MFVFTARPSATLRDEDPHACEFIFLKKGLKKLLIDECMGAIAWASSANEARFPYVIHIDSRIFRMGL
jgi:hypothetical protein